VGELSHEEFLSRKSAQNSFYKSAKKKQHPSLDADALFLAYLASQKKAGVSNLNPY
jgi:hypothetical protein